jgi:hypothetical protein
VGIEEFIKEIDSISKMLTKPFTKEAVLTELKKKFKLERRRKI